MSGHGILSTPHLPAQPADYETPPFPSLYWPIPVYGAQAHLLYTTADIWRFTFYWTLICYGTMFMVCAGYAVIMSLHWHNGSWKAIWVVPVLYAFTATLEATVAGSIVGGLLGAVYEAGSFKMSTWTPFLWAIINSLILILSSFAVQGVL